MKFCNLHALSESSAVGEVGERKGVGVERQADSAKGREVAGRDDRRR